jgi:hypothetical protein
VIGVSIGRERIAGAILLGDIAAMLDDFSRQDVR